MNFECKKKKDVQHLMFAALKYFLSLKDTIFDSFNVYQLFEIPRNKPAMSLKARTALTLEEQRER